MEMPSQGTNATSKRTAMPMPSAAGGTKRCPGPAGSASPIRSAKEDRPGHHLAARLDLDRPEDGHGLSHHQRPFVDVYAAADRHRIALDDAAGLELDGSADADRVALDDLPLAHGDVALEDAHHLAA